MPYVALVPEDAAHLGLAEGDQAEIEFEHNVWRLPVRILEILTPGTVGVPFGLPGMPGHLSSGFVRLSKVTG
jgi:NADH-quinone oxidoreductase subunit G